MKSTKIFLAAIAIAAIVVSCNKPDKGPEVEKSNAKKSVSIAIANMDNGNGGSRAAGDFTTEATNTIPVASTDELWAVFADEDGDLVAIDEDGTIAQKLTAAVNQNADDETAITELYAYTFHELPFEVEQIAITDIDPTMDNPLADEAGVKFETLAEIIAYGQSVAGFEAQSGTTMALKDIFVYGVTETTFTASGLVENHGGVDIVHYNGGEVTVLPMLARIEIGNIFCTDFGEDGAQFGELTLGAIGIHNVFNAVDEEADGYALINYVDVEADEEAGIEAYDGLAAWIADREALKWNIDKFSATLPILEGEEGEEESLPYSEDAFVYNFVPGNVPNIILEVLSAEWADEDLDLALDGPFYVKSTGLEGVTTTAAGTIYKVDFEFACKNVKAWTANSDLKCVSIEVIIPTWTITDPLKPSFGE